MSVELVDHIRRVEELLAKVMKQREERTVDGATQKELEEWWEEHQKRKNTRW